MSRLVLMWFLRWLHVFNLKVSPEAFLGNFLVVSIFVVKGKNLTFCTSLISLIVLYTLIVKSLRNRPNNDDKIEVQRKGIEGKNSTRRSGIYCLCLVNLLDRRHFAFICIRKCSIAKINAFYSYLCFSIFSIF